MNECRQTDACMCDKCSGKLNQEAATIYDAIRIIRKRHPEMRLQEVEVVLREINEEINDG